MLYQSLNPVVALSSMLGFVQPKSIDTAQINVISRNTRLVTFKIDDKNAEKIAFECNSVNSITSLSNNRVNASGLLYNIRFSTNIANPLLINGANATPVTTQGALGEIDFLFIRLHWTSTPTAVIALFWRLPPTLGADDKG
jgi:hypothetical protein